MVSSHEKPLSERNLASSGSGITGGAFEVNVTVVGTVFGADMIVWILTFVNVCPSGVRVSQRSFFHFINMINDVIRTSALLKQTEINSDIFPEKSS